MGFDILSNCRIQRELPCMKHAQAAGNTKPVLPAAGFEVY